MTETTPYNSTYKKLAVQWLNEALCFVSSSVLADSFRLRNRQLLVAAKRCKQPLKDNGHDNILQRQLKNFTTMWHIYFLQNKQPAKNKRATLFNIIHQQNITLKKIT
jgi:hypothetical protein